MRRLDSEVTVVATAFYEHPAGTERAYFEPDEHDDEAITRRAASISLDEKATAAARTSCAREDGGS